MSDESLIDDFAASYEDLDAELAEAYKEAMDGTEDEAAKHMHARLEDILEKRLQAEVQE